MNNTNHKRKPITLPAQDFFNVRQIAEVLDLSVPTVYHHAQCLRRLDKRLNNSNALPGQGLLARHHAQRLADYITHVRRNVQRQSPKNGK